MIRTLAEAFMWFAILMLPIELATLYVVVTNEPMRISLCETGHGLGEYEVINTMVYAFFAEAPWAVLVSTQMFSKNSLGLEEDN
jgi:hypothetical protein